MRRILDVGKNQKNRAIEIFSLASTYNALRMSEYSETDKKEIRTYLESKENKINEKIISEVSFLVLNTKEKIEQKYRR